jgi:hypothetical protein
MPANYVLLEKITVGATAISTVTFSGIPQTGYTDLVVKMSTRRDSGANDGIGIRFNGSSAGNYSMRNLSGDGSSAASSNAASVSAIYGYGTNNWATATASTFSNAEFYIPNYTSSNAKSISLDGVIENNATGSFMALTAGLWSLTSAITSIDILPLSGGSFVQYSTFYLYGVAKLGTTPAIVPYATGGDTIMTDGTYWYHAFLSSGTFTPLKGLSCDILAVAGGGSGGYSRPGGGGAGGLLGFTSQSLVPANYTVTIGAGGAFPPVAGVTGNSGNNSQFGALTAAAGGGGGGGGSGVVAGIAGGSSGGSGETSASVVAPSPSGQGSAGGRYNGGGGGATQAGADGYGLGSTTTGKGGDGSSAYSSWGAATGTGENVSGTYWYAGGGAGYPYPLGTASGGNGGGGDNVYPSSPNTAGTANTGGGGAADYQGAGGSGIVIVRYAV